jgi:hypothetical protein
MRTSIPGATPIPYGIDASSLARILPGASDAPAGLPVALNRPGELLRINNAGLDLPAPGIGEPNMSVAERVAAYLTRLAGAWNAPAMRFIERYFAFLNQQIEMHRAELLEKLAPFEGLFAPEDFIHSAPLPLPRACLFAPVEAHGGEPVSADYVQVDFAFWLGAAPVALLAAPSPLTPGAARRRDERLAAAGVTVFTFGATDLADPEFGLFARIVGEQGRRFWEGEALPSAPGTRDLPEF